MIALSKHYTSKYKQKIEITLECNTCLDLNVDPFSDLPVILQKFTNDSDEMYKHVFEHLQDLQYISSELCDEQEINDIANMSIDEGLEYLKYVFEMYDVAVEDDCSDVIITYMLCNAWSKGYPLVRFYPGVICHCPIYREDIPQEDIKWFNYDEPITRSMQTLFTIHALIYDKKDVKQWWNDLSERCKNTFKQELNIILNDRLQREYLQDTKYFDEFMKIFNVL